ncbi:hypothetical protein FA95DRAFT_1682258, partial [Auriscalpium vulgare]
RPLLDIDPPISVLNPNRPYNRPAENLRSHQVRWAYFLEGTSRHPISRWTRAQCFPKDSTLLTSHTYQTSLGEHSYSRLSDGVKYYFVDYGISSEFPLDSDSASRLAVGRLERDQEPPKLSDTVPYDPFKLDIFVVANNLRREYYEVWVPTDRLRVS